MTAPCRVSVSPFRPVACGTAHRSACCSVQIRPAVHGRADAAKLGEAGWERSHDGWKILQARAHTVNFSTLDAAASWFIDRIDELAGAGLLDLLASLKPSNGAAATEGDAAEVAAARDDS